MNYLILFDDINGRFDKKDIHEKITKHLSTTAWWHYLSNAYILITTVTSAGITNSLSNWYPGLLFLVIKIDPNDASGVLPKEAFDWLRDKGNQSLRIKTTPLPKIKLNPHARLPQPSSSQLLADILRSGSQSASKKPKTIQDLLSTFIDDK